MAKKNGKKLAKKPPLKRAKTTREVIDEIKHHFDVTIKAIQQILIKANKAQLAALKNKDTKQDHEIAKIKTKVGMLA